MNDISLVGKISALKEFAEETRAKINEFQTCKDLGILGQSMAEGMASDIQKRIEFVDCELVKVFEAIQS
jgi:hypothetical protein